MTSISSILFLKEYIDKFNTTLGSGAIKQIPVDVDQETIMLLGQSLLCPYSEIKGTLYWDDQKNPLLIPKGKKEGIQIGKYYNTNTTTTGNIVKTSLTNRFFMSGPGLVNFLYFDVEYNRIFMFEYDYEAIYDKIQKEKDRDNIIRTLYGNGVYIEGKDIFCSCYESPSQGQLQNKIIQLNETADTDFVGPIVQEIKYLLNTTWPVVRLLETHNLIPSDIMFPNGDDATWILEWNKLIKGSSCANGCPSTLQNSNNNPVYNAIINLVKILKTQRCTDSSVCIGAVVTNVGGDYINSGDIKSNINLNCGSRGVKGEKFISNTVEKMENNIISEKTPFPYNIFVGYNGIIDGYKHFNKIQCYDENQQPILVRFMQHAGANEQVEITTHNFLQDTVNINGKDVPIIKRAKGFYYSGIDNVIYYAEPDFSNPNNITFTVNVKDQPQRYKYTVLSIKGWYRTAYTCWLTKKLSDKSIYKTNYKEKVKMENGQIVLTTNSDPKYTNKINIPQSLCIPEFCKDINNYSKFVTPLVPGYDCPGDDTMLKFKASLNACKLYTNSTGSNSFSYDNETGECIPRTKDACMVAQLVESKNKQFYKININNS